MATNPIGAPCASVTDTNRFPVVAAGHIASKLLDRHSAHEIAEAIEVLVDLLDCLGGDVDLEDDDPPEPTGDEEDAAWTEFHTRGRHKLAVGKSEPFDRAGEDSEEDDATEEDDPSGQSDEDGVNTGGGEFWVHAMKDSGPGCPISDPGEFADGL